MAEQVEEAGASMINSGVGWHESRIPTIATSVPRAAFSWTTAKLRKSGRVKVPIVATNRINTPELAESILEAGDADLISMARPLLADEKFMQKVAQGKSHLINVCIACNQACLDHTFSMRRASCLVNPRAGHETKLNYLPTSAKKNVAVVGGGPAGMAASTVAAERGHSVTLFEASDRLGGQFNYAKAVPGKEEFTSTIVYYQNMIKEHNVTVKLGTKASVADLRDFDEIIIATGVSPRIPNVPGLMESGIAVVYDEILSGRKTAGKRVAIMGAGGIGFDMASFLGHQDRSGKFQAIDDFNTQWGVTKDGSVRGGVIKDHFEPAQRTLYLLQRKQEKLGKRLGKTTGWIHRTALAKEGVEMIGGVHYKRATSDGLMIEVDGKERLLEVDTIVICTGQTPMRALADELGNTKSVHIIGGAFEAKELDAKAAIKMASEVAAKI